MVTRCMARKVNLPPLATYIPLPPFLEGARWPWHKEEKCPFLSGSETMIMVPHPIYGVASTVFQKKHPPPKRGRGGPFAARCTDRPTAAHNKVKRPDGASVLPSGRPTRPDRALGIPPTDVCRAGHCQEWRPLLRFPSLRICGEISPSREMWDNGSVGVRPMWSRRRRIYLNARRWRRGRPNR